jgi:hypothetical protein
MPNIELLYTMLQNDLSAPRVLLEQVVNYINDHYNYPGTDLAKFFEEKYPTLEDYEVDLTFSPQYTPAEHHRLEYIPALGAAHLSPSDLALLKRRLYDSGMETVLKSPDGRVEVRIAVHETFIDRYVNLLHLEHKLPENMYEEILKNVPESSRHEVNLLAREDVWHSEARQQILIAFLRVFRQQHNFSTVKVSFLTNFIRTYRPAHLFDLQRQFESLIESCQNDMENVAGHGFHDEYLKALNVGNDLALSSEHDVWSHYKHMMDLAGQLKADFQHLNDVVPDIVEKARQQLSV